MRFAGWLATAILAAAGPISAQTTYVVNTTADPGDGVCDQSECTLFEAIESANQDGAQDTVAFNIPGDGPHSIRPKPFLPLVLQSVVIDGYTQPGSSPATDGAPAVIMIEVDGSAAAADVHGFEIESNDVVIRGLAVNRFARGGILIFGSSNAIEGNFLGTDVSGREARGNGFESNDDNLYDGVWIVDGTDNTIGGPDVAMRNVLSGNANAGVFIAGQGGNRVEGNLIGIDATGASAIPNQSPGVTVFASAENVIHRNVISGNLWFGIDIFENPEVGGHATRNVVTGNYIGTDATGTARLGNAAGGILFNGSENIVGGASAAKRNVISGNLSSGIIVFDPEGPISSTGNVIIGNWIGLTSAGDDTLGNAGTGVRLAGSSNRVGGVSAGEGNVIAASRFAAISIRGDETPDSVAHNVIQGNYLGTDATGTRAFGNVEDGVAVIRSRDNLIGGEEEGARNLMAGNLGGVFIFGEESARNLVQGNDIGINAEGTSGLANLEWGVDILEGVDNSVNSNRIANNGVGGVNVTNTRPAGKRTRRYASSVIAARDGHGGMRYASIPISQNVDWPSLETTTKSAQAGEGNRINDNRIFNNVFYGIDLGQDGPTANDPADADDGPNKLQNYPELEFASSDASTMTLRLNLPSSTSNTAYPVDVHVYLADQLGQGSRPLATVTLPATRAGETVEYVVDIDAPLGPESRIVATATDADGNTSEFSDAIEVETPPVAVDDDGVPGELSLGSNYPNPFSHSTTLYYTIDRTAVVTLTVVDVLGREVARLVDRATRPAGFVEIRFDGRQLRSGAYAFVLDVDGRRLIRRTTVLR